MNDKKVHAIREHLKVRKSESLYFFVSRQYDRMAASKINQIFNQYSDIITPKLLRHYFCDQALDTEEYRSHEVANKAGHSNVQGDTDIQKTICETNEEESKRAMIKKIF